MATIDLTDYTDDEGFVLHFGGNPREVNTYTFANALLAFSDAYRELNDQIYHGEAIELRLEALAVTLSTATIAIMGRRTARRFEGFCDRVAEIIRTAAPVKHLDETGIRIDARTRWLHVLCTPLLTALRIATGRGHLDEKLEGIVIHDDYATYFTLEGVRHGACNAHHLRELQALIEIEKEGWATTMHWLLARANKAARFAREDRAAFAQR